MSATPSGTIQPLDRIQNIQTDTDDYDASHIICNPNGSIQIKGNVTFDPPPVISTNKISSVDQSAQVECLDGGQTQITGELDMQDNPIINLPDPQSLQEPTTLNYIQNNYTTGSQTSQEIGMAISGLSSVYMPIDETLDAINPPIQALDLNFQRISNLADPQQQDDGISLSYLQANYTDTTLSQQYVNQSIAGLSTVYYPQSYKLNQIAQPTASMNFNGQRLTNIGTNSVSTDAVRQDYLTSNYTNTTNSQAYVGTQIAGLSSVYLPLSTKLNQISAPDSSVSMASQKLISLAPGTQPTDAVNYSQITGLLPTTTNINGLTAQTATYDSSGYQITVSSPPNVGNSLTNKTYVDSQITSIQNNYVSNSSLASTLSSYILSSALTTILSAYVTATSLASTLTSYVSNSSLASTLTSYVSNSSLASTLSSYVTLVYLQANYITSSSIASTYASISSLSNYVLASTLTTTLLDYATLTYLQANYYSQTYLIQNFQTIQQMTNYYTKSAVDSLLSSYLLSSVAVSTYQTLSGMSQYLLVTTAQNTYQTISGMSSYLLSSTASSLYQTISGMSAYLQIANIPNYTQSIQTNTTNKSKVDCSTSNVVNFNINDVRKLQMYVPSGQATNPCGLITDDKLQLVSNLNSFSMTGNANLQAKPAQNYTGVYIQGQDSATLNVGGQLCVQPGQYCQNLTLSSGHTDVGGIQVPYSTLSNASGSIQNNLQISAGTIQTDNTIVLYSDAYATSLGQNLSCQFTKKTGYNSAVNITEPNQFVTKSYSDGLISGLSSIYLSISNFNSQIANYYTKTQVDSLISGLSSIYLSISSFNSQIANYYTKTAVDSLISGLSSVYLTISSFNSQIANYYTKIQSDARFYLNNVTLDNITAPTGTLNMNSQKITNLVDPTLPQDACTKYYVDNIGSGISLATGKANFYTLDGTNTVQPSATLEMNSQKISGLGNGTLSADAINLGQANARYTLITTELNNLTAPTGNLSLNNQKITGLQAGSNNSDGVNYSQLTTQISTAISGVFQFQTGMIQMWCKTTAPSGFLICDGSAYNTTTYSALFAVLGSGNLPDFRGKFVRGYDPTNVIDPDTRAILSTQQDAYKNHLHSIPSQTYSTQVDGAHSHSSQTSSLVLGTGSRFAQGGNSSGNTVSISTVGSNHSHSIVTPVYDSSNSTTGNNTETRPVNVALVYIIKY